MTDLLLPTSNNTSTSDISSQKALILTTRALAMQAIGAEGVVAAQCRALVKSYLPQLIKIIATMPSDQVCFAAVLLCCWDILSCRSGLLACLSC